MLHVKRHPVNSTIGAGITLFLASNATKTESTSTRECSSILHRRGWRTVPVLRSGKVKHVLGALEERTWQRRKARSLRLGWKMFTGKSTIGRKKEKGDD